jgi:AcrR family transcriptional regulator
MSDLETKEKIIKAARILFADLGYEGTSVREIAKTADVNVASVNYYFSSKENLFLEIMRSGYVECAQDLKSLLEKNHGNLENTLVDFFHHFLTNSHDLLSHFKMMMSSQHSHLLVAEGTEDATFGPPGGMIISEVLKKESPNSSSEELIWAIRTVFSHVTHLSLIHTCCLRTNQNLPCSTKNDLEKSIRRVTRMVIHELKYPQHSASNL